MRSKYRRLGDYIKLSKELNDGMQVKKLRGISNAKYFVKAKTNTIGIDLQKYRIVRTGQFAFNRATTRNGDKISISLRKGSDCIVSPSYRIFEVKDENVLSSEYLMMWFRRPEFNRYARYKSHGSAHEFFGWEEMCEVELPVPPIEEQREIVKEYQTIVKRIKLIEQLNQKLEETCQAIYKRWFVDLMTDEVDEIYSNLDEYILFNPNHSIKKDAVVTYVEMADLKEDGLSINNVVKRPYTSGTKFKNGDTLLARITPCLENGKTAFVNCLDNNSIAYGSTEFIVMRAKDKISPYWVYCLARDKNFRSYAISSMVGTSGRQRVHSDYLKVYSIPTVDYIKMAHFHELVEPLFKRIKLNSMINKQLIKLRDLLLVNISTNKKLQAYQ